MSDKWVIVCISLWLVFLLVMDVLGVMAHALAIVFVCTLFLGINGYQLYAFTRE